MPDAALALGGFTHEHRANIPLEELVLNINKELSCRLEPQGRRKKMSTQEPGAPGAHRGRQQGWDGMTGDRGTDVRAQTRHKLPWRAQD